MSFSLTKPGYNVRILWALGLHSAGIIAYQLILMQLISIMQWYHFAYMIISIAMLGFGASGTFIALYKEKLLSAYTWLIPVLMSGSGLFMMASFYLARQPGLQFDVYLLFVEKSQFRNLAANYLIFFMPFFFGALAIGLIFIKNAHNIGKYYFSNLLGSGIGGIIAVVLLSSLFPIQALPAVACISIIASMLLMNLQRIYIQSMSMFLALALAVLMVYSPGEVPMSEYKGLPKTLHLPEAEVVYKKPDIHGQIEVVESPALRYAPALSLQYMGNVPVKKNVYTNAEFYGVIPKFDSTTTNIHDYTSEALPYVMQPRENVLLLKAGTGSAIAHALQNGSKKVVGIVEVKGIKEMMQNKFAEESGNLFFHDRVEITYQDSRQFLFTDTLNHYDAIVLPRMESFGGSTGLHALHENYTLTLEAFQQMWEKLSPHGVISLTSWVDYPPRTTLKIAATLIETLRNQGIDNPINHIAAIRSWGTISFVITKSPITSKETQNIRTFCQKMNFDPVLLPGITDDERERYNILEDKSILNYLDDIINNDQAEILQEYDFYIKPSTDDKPYFERFLKLGKIKKLYKEFGMEQMPFLELGYLIVWITLAQSTLLALILIILPLYRLKGKTKSKSNTLLYFGALGLGYMFVEIIFIQRFILYFGHPVYAISAVISTMMIASGIGSLYSGKMKNALKASKYSTLIVSVLLLFYALFFTDLLTATIQLPTVLKIMLALVLLAIPSFFMGMPFPSGIRFLYHTDELQIPWAWGINGCLSVIATSLATLVAVEQGFQLVMFLAMGLYLLASVISFLIPQSEK